MIVFIFGLLLLLFALLPISMAGAWWIRGFDFPRFQLLAVSIVFVVIALAFHDMDMHGYLGVAMALVAIGLDLYRVLPYSPFRAKETPDTSVDSRSPSLTVLSANVLQENRSFKKLEQLIEQEQPDLVVLVEVDQWWSDNCESLKDFYPHFISLPQSNTYGMYVASKLPLSGTEIDYLVDSKVPSVFTSLELTEHDSIDVICVHPRPPRPQEGPSDQRDAELVTIAKRIKDKGDNNPTIVVGDFNDVAWSHTTRLFRRISGTLDPRVGRGTLATFPVAYPFCRFPLDHIFHTPNFSLSFMRRLPTIGSDHFPLLTKLDLNHRVEESVGQVSESDKKDAAELQERGDEWSGPSQSLD